MGVGTFAQKHREQCEFSIGTSSLSVCLCVCVGGEGSLVGQSLSVESDSPSR